MNKHLKKNVRQILLREAKRIAGLGENTENAIRSYLDRNPFVDSGEFRKMVREFQVKNKAIKDGLSE